MELFQFVFLPEQQFTCPQRNSAIRENVNEYSLTGPLELITETFDMPVGVPILDHRLPHPLFNSE